MDSTAFCKGYRHLSESVSVVRFGRVGGVYIPVPDAAMDEAPSNEADTPSSKRQALMPQSGQRFTFSEIVASCSAMRASALSGIPEWSSTAIPPPVP